MSREYGGRISFILTFSNMFCVMRSSIVMLKNHFSVSLVVLRPFVFQYLA